MLTSTPSVGRLDASALRMRTLEPEADGTLAWDATTIVIARACCFILAVPADQRDRIG